MAGPTKRQFVKLAKLNDTTRIWIQARVGKVKWTNGMIMVYNEPVLAGELEPGTYTVKSNMIVPDKKKFPSLELPDRRKYNVAQRVKQDGYFQTWHSEFHGWEVIPLKAKAATAYIRFEIYDYLIRDFDFVEDQQWKVKGSNDLVLFYANKELMAVVAPISMNP